MPKFLFNRWHGMHMVWSFVLILALTVVLFFYKWFVGTLSFACSIVLLVYVWRAEIAFRKDFKDYIGTLSHRVKKAGSKVINELPFGVLLYNENDIVEWHNPYLSEIVGIPTAVELSLFELFPNLEEGFGNQEEFELNIGDRDYQIIVNSNERLLFLQDRTDWVHLSRRYANEKTVIGILMLDNLEESTQGMDDQTRSIMIANVTGQITEWAQKNNVFVRRTSADKFLLILHQEALDVLEESQFDIIDVVRDGSLDLKVPFTISIGIATGSNELVDLGSQAQSSLDMALGRGGDQAAVKSGDQMSFYGGRSNALEKRTRVRARVVSHALRDLILESDNVVIMGHRNADMDALGAAVGVLKAVHTSRKEGYVVLEGTNPSIGRMLHMISEHETLNRWFISPEEASQIMNSRTLIIVVDTHKVTMTAEPRLLGLSDRVVIIDHHRRGEDMIEEPLLTYIEPYASSTCELVTELLQYYDDRITMDTLEATVLLSGIVVDTKSFAHRTGARTFEAASYLRRHGADLAKIQNMMKEDLAVYIEKADIVKRANVIYEHIAIAVTEAGKATSQLMIAQAADILLNMTNIRASFVVSERTDGRIGISARSLGEINVQVIMERLGGGGHLSNAAVQLDCSLEEAEQQLMDVLKEIDEKEGIWE